MKFYSYWLRKIDPGSDDGSVLWVIGSLLVLCPVLIALVIPFAMLASYLAHFVWGFVVGLSLPDPAVLGRAVGAAVSR